MSRYLRYVRLALTDPSWLLRALSISLHLFREQGVLGLLAKIDPPRFSAPLYRRWLQRYPLPCAPQLKDCQVDLLLVLQDATSEELHASLESIQYQQHAQWKIWIACPPHSGWREGVPTDERIQFIDASGSSAAQWNRLLQSANGNLVLPLRAGQVLHPALLAWLAWLFDNNGLQAASWDCDELDSSGRRHSPQCRPSWDPWLIRSSPAQHTPLAMRRSQLSAIGGFTESAGNACEYDLMLRLIEQLEPGQIRHLPLLLSHLMPLSKPPTVGALHCQSIVNHCARSGIASQIKLGSHNNLCIHLTPPAPEPAVAIIMPTRDGGGHLRTAVSSLLRHTHYPNYHLYIVDNGSQTLTTLTLLEELASDPRCTILRDPAPFNFSALNNRAIALTHEPLLCLLNDDVEIITPHWLTDLVGAALQPGVGAAGARLWYPQGGLQHAGVIVGYGGGAGHAHRTCASGNGLEQSALLRSFSAVTAACLVTQRQLYQAIGGLDAEHFPVNFNDVDFCLKLREAHHDILYVPTAELIHHESLSRGQDRTPAQLLRYDLEVATLRSRWAHWIAEDPAYSPSLTLRREDHSLAWPPRRPSWLSVTT